MWATYGPIDVARLTDVEVAGLAGYASRREDPTVQIDDYVDGPQDQRCPYPPGSIEALYFLRGEPLPLRMNGRTPDQCFAHAPKANRGATLADRHIVTGVILFPSIVSRDDADINITYTAGEPEESDWLIPDRDSK